MVTKITQSTMDAIASYMNPEIREWTHYNYAPCEPEILIKNYYLRLLYEDMTTEADEFEKILWEEFSINIDNLVTYDEKQNAIDKWL